MTTHSESEQAYTLKSALNHEVPQWLKRHADLWINDPSAEAVVQSLAAKLQARQIPTATGM